MSHDKQTRYRKRNRRSSDFERLSRRFMSGLLRSLFFSSRSIRTGRAGFVLPTTALLLLVLTLTVGALSFRTFSRSSSTIAQSEQQVVDSAAAPTIDRAKAKLEYLFANDPRFPGGVPSSDVLASMMLNDGNNGVPSVTENDPYTFPNETRIDINNDSGLDNAWVFESDVDGNGTVEPGELIVYSILMDDDDGSGNVVTDPLSDAKADGLVTRNGPINTTEVQSGCGVGRAPEAGWQVISSATLQKNFQVTAFVANRNNAVNNTVSALEFQQVRQASRGNKWGAWFKYDLEIFPGASEDFFWNGAMHTDGNLLIRDKYIARMISSQNSCLYTEDASEVTMESGSAFEGQLLSAKISENAFLTEGGTAPPGMKAKEVGFDASFHLFTTDDARPVQDDTTKINANTDSVDADREDLRNILVDPIKLFTDGEMQHRSTAGWTRDSSWDGSALERRIYNNSAATPYLDDTYRADNRYGPKSRYDDVQALPPSTSIGAAITGNTALTALDAAGGIYGLDGYWERRAIGQGLRVIVGQRLELGNAFGWEGAPPTTSGMRDPLYPIDNNNNPTSAVQIRQRRTLYDNLAAVQGMVVYHYQSGSNGALPLACIASTVHPGTETTIENSRSFGNYATTGALKTDFLTGQGTDGWEFDFHSNFSTKVAAAQPLGIALRNLAYFAGDSNGGAPSYVPVQDTVTHPYPYQAMWGDFSNLRHVVDSGTAYASLSPADQSTLQSAACTLGLLAYDLTTLEAEAKGILADSAADIADPLVVNAATITTEPTIFDRVTALNNQLPSGRKLLDPEVAIIERYLQVERDRRVGFLEDADLDAGATICTADDFAGISNSAATTSLVAAFCPKTSAEKSKYPSLYYIFPEFDHGQLGADDTSTAGILLDHTQPSDEEYIAQTGPTNSYSTKYLTDSSVGINRSVTYKVVGDGNTDGVEDPGEASISAIALTPRDFISGGNPWRLPTSDAPGGSTFDANSMQIIVGSSLKEVSLLDKAMFDGREHMSIRLLDFDVNKLSAIANTNSDGSGTPEGPDNWISTTDGIVYAFREDAVREDSIVRPKEGSTGWADCDTWAEVYNDDGSDPFGITTANRNCRLKNITTFPFLQDPPLMTDTNISTKPIDFYPDPDRRPYGFRLVNGATLHRANTVQAGMTFVSDNLIYIKGDFNLHTSAAFNPTDANACTKLLEEFIKVEKLFGDDCSRTATVYYYDGRQNQNSNFANPAATVPSESDKWRPVEIVGDAVGILSRIFKDGNIQDTYTLARTESDTTGYGTSSYQNQNRLSDMTYKTGKKKTDYPVPTAADWKHVDGTTNAETPIRINRNGGPIMDKNATRSIRDDGFAFPGGGGDKIAKPSQHLQFGHTEKNARRGDQQNAVRTMVNAVFISGIIPSQAGQSYGGMHNFLRFVENWDTVDLHVSGGFFQLNFSTSATAPFDQDAWEAASATAASEPIVNSFSTNYYGAPNRKWGYDVALQYAPAAAVARRFVTVGRPRSEFYRELPADDAYVKNLRCAVYRSGPNANSQVYPNESCP